MNETILPSLVWQDHTLDITAALQYDHDASKPYYLKVKTSNLKTFKAKVELPPPKKAEPVMLDKDTPTSSS